jgi:pimeloyl-ACP methyl ester carboxylesterase
MNAFMSSIEDAIITAFLGADIGWPRGVLATLELEVCCKVRNRLTPNSHDHGTKPRPTLLLGPGLNTTRLLYSASAQHLASLGYEVIVTDHPYETDAVQFPDGSVILGGRVPRDPNATEALAHALDVRSKDAGFVLDYLGIDKKGRVVFVGDSFGGPAAADVMLKDARVKAGVNVDGMMFGPAVEVGVDGPFLTLGSPGHNSSSDATWARFREAMRVKHPRIWEKELSLAGSVHGLLSDFGLVGDVAGLRGTGQLVGNVFGEITGARTMEILREYLSDFSEFALEGKGQGLLAGPSWKYPEVIFV